MAEQITVTTTELGLDAGLTQAATGDTFFNDGNTLLLIQNGDAALKTVTLTSRITANTDTRRFGKVTKVNRAYAVPAGAVWVAGPFPIEAFNDASGFCALAYSAVTNLKVAIIRMPN